MKTGETAEKIARLYVGVMGPWDGAMVADLLEDKRCLVTQIC